MQIGELRLKNFRCLEEYTVLLGINGSGKSSVPAALRIVTDGFVTSSQRDFAGTMEREVNGINRVLLIERKKCRSKVICAPIV